MINKEEISKILIKNKFPAKSDMPYRVGDRTLHRSPGHRSWSETWYDPKTGHYSHHQGLDELWHVLFWEEVDMLTGRDATVEELREKMKHLSREDCCTAAAHYFDLWNWESGSDKDRRLMEAFEAEAEDPSIRLCEEKMINKFVDDYRKEIAQAFGCKLLAA